MTSHFTPRPEHHFTFGLWTVGNTGRDPFGEPVRAPLSAPYIVRKLAELGAYGVNFHDEDLIPRDATGAEREKIIKEFRAALSETGLKVPMATTNLFTDPAFRDGAFTSNDARVRRYALQKTMRSMDLGKEFGAETYVFWGGREGTETNAARDTRDAIKWFRESLNFLCEYSRSQGYDYRFALEPKPNEPRGDIYLPTIGHALAFITTLDHPEMVGVNPEVAHDTMAGLDFTHGVAQALDAGKLFHIDLNDQKPGRYDQDFRFGAVDQKQAFFLVKLLRDANYDGMRHFDAKAFRTEDEKGVWAFAAGCMRTYLILDEKAQRWNADKEIQQIVGALRTRGASSGDSAPFSKSRAEEVKNQTLDLKAIREQGYDYERLDQLTVELLLEFADVADALFLGLDVGTSGVKAILVSAAGEVVASAVTPLSLGTPQPGWAEQDPEAWWSATLASIAVLRERMPGARVASIGISGQMHSSVFLDRAGTVIRPALLWCDGRTTEECAEITTRAGCEERLRDWVRNPALEGFTLPKVLWLRNHEPQAYARLATVLLAKDFIRYRLTSVLATEPSDASGTLMFDPAGMRWSEEALRAVDVSPSLLPAVGGSAEVLGRLTSDVAKISGLEAGTPVVGGGADNACGAAGVGALVPGEAVASWGTSGTVLAPTAQPLVDPALRAHTFCHVAPDVWYLMGVILTAGGAFSWYQQQFARELRDAAGASGRLDEEAATVSRGADGVTFLPYLQGERTPHRDASMRGAFLGLSLAHSRAHLTRAVLEGVCFAMRDSVGILRDLGLSPRSLLLTGGGTKSAFLRKLQAEIYGLPVQTVNREEGPAYGAALLAAVGVGEFPDIATAARTTLTRSALEHPEPSAHASYDAAYARFRASAPAAREFANRQSPIDIFAP